MAARPRIRRRANWPDNLHEPRPGYYTWRDPIKKETHVLGRMPLAQAMEEARQANLEIARVKATKTLAERIAQPRETVADLLEKMPVSTRDNTVATRRHQDKVIRESLGSVACADLTTKQISDLLEKVKNEGKLRSAKMLRARLLAVCARGAALGWMTSNPATITEKIKAPTKRKRLSLEAFNAILEKAPEVTPWLQNAMLLALVSGQDRSTIGAWTRTSVKDGVASVQRAKTGVVMEIPLELRMDAIDMTLGDVIARCKTSGVVSKYLIHHMSDRGNVTRGAPIPLGSISSAFAEARLLAGISGENAPSFHEIRSLSKRLYDAQGNVDTKQLLGHLTDKMSELYANNRGLEPIRVNIKKAG